MKKLFIFASLAITFILQAQFTVTLKNLDGGDNSEAYLYTLNGSKDVLSSKVNATQNQWVFKVDQPYNGMLRVYFPQNNNSINLIAENKNVSVTFHKNNGKIEQIKYLDESNELMNNVQDVMRKKELILPALYQMKEYYVQGSSFGDCLEQEISRLSQKTEVDAAKHPFIAFYNQTYKKFITQSADKPKPSAEEIINFISSSDEMLESSSLLQPILISYLNSVPKNQLTTEVDKLLKSVNVETPRGQTVLAELIDIFDTYDMQDLKSKYLSEASSLKCTLNNRLSQTIETNKNVEIGAEFPNYKFTQVLNTSAKSIYDVKASKKIILFWSSTCSHCEQELPELIAVYNQLKQQNIQIIGLSIDTDRASYMKRAKDLPWINDAEMQGWNSSYAQTYNVHATPTYFILDSNNKIIAKPDHVGDVLKFLKLK